MKIDARKKPNQIMQGHHGINSNNEGGRREEEQQRRERRRSMVKEKG
jgi:hypothetical protein